MACELRAPTNDLPSPLVPSVMAGLVPAMTVQEQRGKPTVAVPRITETVTAVKVSYTCVDFAKVWH